MPFIYCFECPKCGKKHATGAKNRDEKKPDVNIIFCCGQTYRVAPEKLAVETVTEAELAALGPLVDSGSWVPRV